MVLGEPQLQSWQSLQYHSQMHAWDAWSSTWHSQHLLELGQPRNLPGDPRSLSLSPFLGPQLIIKDNLLGSPPAVIAFFPQSDRMPGRDRMTGGKHLFGSCFGGFCLSPVGCLGRISWRPACVVRSSSHGGQEPSRIATGRGKAEHNSRLPPSPPGGK